VADAVNVMNIYMQICDCQADKRNLF
jgi:hypothetical protein